jgi:medium-chain acyl-[acyl-carrier-protein] hydrolase
MSCSTNAKKVGYNAMNPWFAYTRTNANARLRLFCFPYSGGGALLFRDWAASLPATIDVYPVELPGRGVRISEALANRVSPLVRDIAQALYPYLDRPFAFFGHSLGALLSFELAHYLVQEHARLPAHLFVSAHRAPQVPDPDSTVYTLSDHELIEKLRRLDGTPEEILREPELMSVLLPIVRKDFEICNTYVYMHRRPLGCPISAFGGSKDALVARNDLQPWAEQTSATFSSYMLPGGHLFMNTSRHLLLSIISRELQQAIECA